MPKIEHQTIVEKLWGSELIIINHPQYCGKILTLKPGFQCSLHAHHVKAESFLTMSGVVELETYEHAGILNLHRLNPGEAYRIEPGVYHRFRSVGGPATMIEFSSHHEDSDTYRLEESRAI